MKRQDAVAGRAWLVLALTVAAHVVDEAATHFLDYYNPYAAFLRARTGLPLPVFNFATWVSALAAAVAVLFLLAPFVFRGARWMRPVQYFVAIAMMANGAAHIVASLSWHRLAPGAISAPFLLVAAAALLYTTARQRQAAPKPQLAGSRR